MYRLVRKLLFLLHHLSGNSLIEVFFRLNEEKLESIVGFGEGGFGLSFGSFEVLTFHILVDIIVEYSGAISYQNEGLPKAELVEGLNLLRCA